MQNSIKNFFQYDGEYAKKWLVEAVYFTIKLNRNDSIISDILKLSHIEIDIDTFLLEIKAYLKQNTDIKYDKKRSPEELQNSISTWVYYSIFWAFDAKKTDKQNFRKYRLITRMALEFHHYYLNYITKVDEKSRINTKSLEYAAVTVGRVIEILTKIAQKKQHI